MAESSAVAIPTAGRSKRLLTLWDLIFFGIVLIQPIAPVPLFGVAQKLSDGYFTAMADDLKARRDLLAVGLQEVGFEVYQPDGTYFITTDIAPLGEKDAMEFCLDLPDRAGVVAIPSAVFYDDHPEAGRTMVRFAFCKRPEVLKEAIGRLSVLAGSRKAKG